MSQYKNSINIKEQNINNSIFQTNNKQDNNNEYYSSNYFLLNTNRNRNIDCNNIKKDPYCSGNKILSQKFNKFKKLIDFEISDDNTNSAKNSDSKNKITTRSKNKKPKI